MSIDNITAKILSDAQKTAEDTLKNADEAKSEIISNAKADADAALKASSEKAVKEAEDLKSRKVSAAELQGRKMLLAAKQEAIKKSFNVVIEKLKTMPEQEYLNFMTDKITEIPNCEGTIVLNAKDRQNIGEKLVKAVNDKLNAQKVLLGNNTISASGGFVLKKGNIEINSTFETIIDSMKDNVTGEIAHALFK